jgi:hypothetical protein
MAAGATFEPISTTTLGSAQSSVTFSTISGSYTDLVAVINGTATTAFGQLQMRINADTGTTYSTTYLWGTGSAAVSDRDSSISGGMNPGFIGTGQGTNIFHIQNYSNTTTYKTVVARSSVTGNRVAATVNLWRSTSAITELRFNILGGDTFASGTTFTLYGILSA